MPPITVDHATQEDESRGQSVLELTLLERTGRRSPLSVSVRDLVLGGFTGRDRGAIERHFEELAAIGVTPPEEVPAFWPVSPALLTTTDQVTVHAAHTSGEVEFALIGWDGQCLVAVASDHTDRDIEAESIPRAKALYPKVMSVEVVPFQELQEQWDDIVLTCDIRDGDGPWTPYQRERLASVMEPDRLVREHRSTGRLGHGEVLLSGTIPLLDGATCFPGRYRCSLVTPDPGVRLDLEYGVSVVERQGQAR